MNDKFDSELLKVHPALQMKVAMVMMDCIEKAKKVWGEKVSRIPDLKWETKGRVAGWAHYNKLTNEYWINLNPILFNENVAYYLEQTVPHEMAHIITYLVYGTKLDGIKPHGREWKYVMRVVGAKFGAKRCHTLDCSSVEQLRKPRQRTIYQLTCPKCNAVLAVSPNLITKMRKGRTYTHRGCGGKLGESLFRLPLDN